MNNRLISPNIKLISFQQIGYNLWKDSLQNNKIKQNDFDTFHISSFDLSEKSFSDLLKRWQEREEQKKEIRYAIFEENSASLLGTLVVYHLHYEPFYSGTIGIALFNQFWGQGLAKKTLSIFLHCYKDHLSLHRLQAWIEPQNTASQKLFESLCFTREGLMKEAIWKRSNWQDLYLYSFIIPQGGSKVGKL